MIETKARERIQSWLQDLLQEEVTELLGRAKSQRRSEDDVVGYRNGYGKPRRIALSFGTVSVRRPRLRKLGDRFESRVLPLFKRRSQELGAMLPRLYLHGLSSGDFELALRGLLGEGAPLSATSLQRLKGVWQAEYEQWKQRDLSQLELVYWWADGLYVKAGIADRKAALRAAIIYTRNDHADGLEIDPRMNAGMKSLTDLTNAEMLESSLRFGMNGEAARLLVDREQRRPGKSEVVTHVRREREIGSQERQGVGFEALASARPLHVEHAGRELGGENRVDLRHEDGFIER